MALLKAPLVALAGFLLLAVVTLAPQPPAPTQLAALSAAVSPTPSVTVTLLPTLQANKLPAVPSAPTPSQLRSAIEAYFTQGLPPSLLSQLKGPKGDPGPAGSPAIALAPAGYSIGSVYPTATSTNTGTIGGISYFGSKDLSTQTLSVSGASTLANLTAGATTLASLTVSGDTSWSVASISSNLDVSGTVSTNDIITKGPWIDVRAYGAKGDNTTNDLVAINNAIAAIPTGGATIYFPPGTYLISSNINAITTANVKIIGAGKGVTTIRRSAAPSSGTLSGIFTIRAAFFEISDLTLQGNGSFGGATNLNGKGIYGDPAPDIYAHNIEAKNLEGEAIYTDGDSPRTRFERNYVHDVAMVALNINSGITVSANSWIIDNVIVNAGVPINVAAKSFTIARNYINNPNFAGTDLILVDGATFIVADNVIEGSNTSAATTSPIHIWTSVAGYTSGTVRGNIIRNNQTGNQNTGAPIFIDNIADGDILIEGNLISENGVAAGHNSPAISVAGVSATARIFIQGNYIRKGSANQQNRGIRIESTVPANNNIIIGANFIDSDVAEPYVFAVQPSSFAMDNLRLKLSDPANSANRKTFVMSSNTLQLRAADDTTPLVSFLNSGNVGIGTETPTTKLDVIGAASVSTNFEVRTGYASLSNTLWVSPTGYAGNVGVGTRTPVTQLTMVGASGGYTALSILDNSYPSVDAGFQIRYNDATGDTYLDSRYFSGPNANIYFRTGTAGTPVNALTILGFAGNIGIGDTTPTAKLELVGGSGITTGSVASISGTSLTTGSLLQLTVPPSSSFSGPILVARDTNNLVLASLSSGGRFSIRGSIFSHGATSNCTGVGAPSAGCLDYAESFPTTDPTLSAGEIVAVDPRNPSHVIRASASPSSAKASDGLDVSHVIGIVSTNPAALIDADAFKSGADAKPSDGSVPIALAGRVPVRISLENGPILPGDRLSLSPTLPGTAVKATTAGMTIGIALEASDNTQQTTKILVFVNLAYHSPELTADESSLFARILDYLKNIILTVRGLVADKIETQQLCVGQTCVDENQLKTLLQQSGNSPNGEPSATPEPSISIAPEVTPIPTPEIPVTPQPGIESTPPETPTPTAEPPPSDN